MKRVGCEETKRFYFGGFSDFFSSTFFPCGGGGKEATMTAVVAAPMAFPPDPLMKELIVGLFVCLFVLLDLVCGARC